MIEQQLALFDYASLDLETCALVQKRTFEIKLLMRRTAQDIVEIGQKLIEVKQKLGHGQFGKWLISEFEWSEPTAQRFMKVSEKFISVNLTDLKIGPSALYLLAAPSTPEIAFEEAIARAEAGEQITYSKAKEIVDWNKHQVNHLISQDNEARESFNSIPPQPTIKSFDTWANEPNPPYEVEEEEEIPKPTPQQPQPLIIQDQPFTILSSSQNDSWRTPIRYLEAAREVLNGIDLDPASSEIANQTVKAMSYFTKEDDGLAQPWIAGTVWINPPYGKTNNMSNQGLFAQKLVDEYLAGNVGEGIILLNNYHGYNWFAPLRELPHCNVDHRISFINPETNLEGDEAKASSIFIYVGKDPRKFYHVFKQFGPCGQDSYDWE